MPWTFLNCRVRGASGDRKPVRQPCLSPAVGWVRAVRKRSRNFLPTQRCDQGQADVGGGALAAPKSPRAPPAVSGCSGFGGPSAVLAMSATSSVQGLIRQRFTLILPRGEIGAC